MSEEKGKIEVKKDNSDTPKKGGCLKGCLTLIILFAILGGLVNACFGGEDEKEKGVKQKDEVPVTTEPKEKEKKEVKEQSLAEKTESAIVDVIKAKTNMKEKRIVSIEGDANLLKITLNADENLSTKLTKEGMWIDTVDALEALHSIDEIKKVGIIWKFPMVDTYGNTESLEVMRIFVDRETLDRINYENFNFQKIPDIAYNYYLHPAFNK